MSSAPQSPVSPAEPQRYYGPTTPPPQPTDLGGMGPIPGLNSAPLANPPGPPPSPPHPPPPAMPFSPPERFIPPVELTLLKTLCAEGRLRDVHQVVTQYLLANEPNPLTGQPDLKIFRQALAQAILHNHPVVVSYLFFMRVAKPSEVIHSARGAKSIGIFEVFLEYGWDINQPLAEMSPPMLG